MLSSLVDTKATKANEKNMIDYFQRMLFPNSETVKSFFHMLAAEAGKRVIFSSTFTKE